MKIYIEYQFREEPYGGANQFLKNLRDYFVKKGIYTERKEEADVLIINHNNISIQTLKLKIEHPEKLFIHRVDGPVSMHRKYTKALDKQSFFLDKMLCSGTVFQSQWTRENCYHLGYQLTGLDTTIHNAPDPNLFTRAQNKREVKPMETRTKLVTTSWSPNYSKGFDLYQYLDENLDFKKYEFVFIGRTNILFQNIKILPPMQTSELAEELKKYDLFIAASKSESCSNSLIEAINSGLPVVARESGSYREVIKEGGILFKEKEDSLAAIEAVAINLESYRKRLPFYHIDDIGKQYYEFIKDVQNAILEKKIQRKKISYIKYFVWKIYTYYVKLYLKITNCYAKSKYK